MTKRIKTGKDCQGQALKQQLEQYATVLDKAEALLGHHFTQRALLLRALTHPSAVTVNALSHSYERLEFLGDAILGAIVCQELYERYPDVAEGGLTRLKMTLVSGQTLSRLAHDLGLQELIIFGSSEQGTGNRGLSSALENSLEALVAALALDGGLELARSWVLEHLTPLVESSQADEPENAKSALQELLQTQHVIPTYEVTATDGPPHDRKFTVAVSAQGKILATGRGHSKKDAEMRSAQTALRKLRTSASVLPLS
ncbi:MAG: ribonuclease III [Coriobacteriales bacterium]|jgi:ribonuclease-3|nr:ribonuclease III [Coriobacteriales bacterium]